METLTEQKRGQLTDRIREKSKELLGYEITQQELRLIPYLQYVIVNEQRINPNNINAEEREILSKWRKAGYIEGGASGLGMTKEFWNIITELIFLGYVDLT
ncbi:MAG TPA: hypothetical protein P5509_06355 [Bacteroidales bacterium]|nr:hypothetical protein [Bacteroidales bacterium]